MPNEPWSIDGDGSPAPNESARLNDEVLNRPVRSPFTGFSLGVGVILVVAILLRILKLDAYLLGAIEGRWASDGWTLFTGSPLPASQQPPDVSPFFQIANAASFFLFGATDATARMASVVLGFGIVVLALAFRPFVSRSHLAGMATLASVSPTLVFASRTVHPAIAVAFFSLLTLVALLRAGAAGSPTTQAGWALTTGLGLAGMLASGVDGVTAMLSLGIGVFAAAVTDSAGRKGTRTGTVRAGVTAIGTSATNLTLVVSGFALAMIVLFSRMLTDLSALSGISSTFADWGRLMVSRATVVPSSFYFWALLLYEMLAVIFAILAMLGRRPGLDEDPARRQNLNPALFGAWFFAALLLHSLASGREAEQTVLVALPLILLGGLGLGDVLARIDASGFWSRRSWGVPVLLGGFVVGLVTAVGIVASAMDADASTTEFPSWLIVLMLVTVVLVTAGSVGALAASDTDRSRPRIVDPVLMLVASALGIFTVVTTAGLAYDRADEGTELLARNVPSRDGAALIERIQQVSRDLSVENRTNIDPTGRFGLNIAISPDVGWPFAWYFRDYPFMQVSPPAGWDENLDVVIATSADGMEAWGLTPQQSDWIVRAPGSFVDLDAGDLFGRLTDVDRWDDALRFLINREIENPQEPITLTIGYSARVGNLLNPDFGPFDLFSESSPGPGSGQGQLNQPSGIGVSPIDDTIYVLNAGNQRIDRFQRDGTFIGVWDGAVSPEFALSWNVNQGGTGLTVGDDGLIYIADTWNHTVIVADEDGTVVRQLGQRGTVPTDITDTGLPSDSPGLFFGPRGVAVTDERIFVTDTGNERVQVFSRDGTFITAFGGFGTGEGELIEPTDIAIGPEGDVWVADSGNARIQVFTIEGEFVKAIPVPSWQGQMGTDRLNALAFGPDGVLYLTSPLAGAVEAYYGEQLVTITNVPAVRAGGIAVSSDGELLVTDLNMAVVHRVMPMLPEGFGPVPAASPMASPGATPAASPATD